MDGVQISEKRGAEEGVACTLFLGVPALQGVGAFSSFDLHHLVRGRRGKGGTLER